MSKQRSNSSGLTLMAVSVHEAGHALAHVLYRVPFKHVSIIPDEQTAGHVLSLDRKRESRLNANWSERRARNYAERLIRCTMAGGLAQIRYNRKSFKEFHTSVDWENAVSFANTQSGSFEESLAWCHLLYIQTKQDISLDYNWKAILALARELKMRKFIRARDARKILQAGEAVAISEIENMA